MTNEMLLYIIGFLFSILFLLIFFISMQNRQRKQAKMRAKLASMKKKDARNNLYFLYRIYMATPILQRYYVKLKNEYRAIIPADEVTLNKMTTKRMSICLAICTGILVLICLVGKGDIAYMLVGFLASYIVFTDLINSSEQKMQMRILDQLDTLISDIHAYYEDSHMVDEALSSCLDNLPYEIGLHANMIHDVITSPDIELAVEQYRDSAPNRFLLLFATICATIQENGDKPLANGRSMFLTNLDHLKVELGNERNRLARRTLAFSGKTFAVLIPLFCLKPLELWIDANIPEISGFYEGSGGVISLAIIMVLTLICYEYINILKDDHSDEGKSDKLYRKIADFPGIRHYLTLWINHNYTKSRRLADKLKSVGDKSGVQVFIVKKFLTAIVTFVVVTIVCIFAIQSEKSSIIHDFEDAYTSSLVPSAEYRETMRDMSAMYTWEIKHGYTDEEFLEVIGGDLEEAYKVQMAAELSKRAKEYQTHYYKYWMLLIGLGFGIFAFYIPNMMLNYKQKIMGMAREDEVAQYRTLIMILMHEDGMTLEKVLEWMERFSHAFQSSITDCILNLERDEEDALETMRENESGFAPFRRLCDNLIAVDKVGLESAFATLEVDQAYNQEKRKEDNLRVLSKCTKTANFLQYLPVWAVIILYLIIPIGLYAMQMYNELNFNF